MQSFSRCEFTPTPFSDIYFNVIEALNYRVPSAKRVFISNFMIPLYPNEDNYNTFNDALDGLVNPPSSQNTSNHEEIFPSHKNAKKIPRLSPNGALVYFQGGRGKTFRNYIRLDGQSYAPTVIPD